MWKLILCMVNVVMEAYGKRHVKSWSRGVHTGDYEQHTQMLSVDGANRANSGGSPTLSPVLYPLSAGSIGADCAFTSLSIQILHSVYLKKGFNR